MKKNCEKYLCKERAFKQVLIKDKKNNSDKINLVLLKKIGLPVINKEYKKDSLGKFITNQLRN